MRTTMFFAIGAAVLVLGGLLAWLYTPDKPRPVLEAAYATPPSQFVDLLGLRLHVRDTGPHDAAVVILLHGFGASLQTWDDWAAPLSAAHRVIRFDLPGFGLTGADPSGDYSDQRSVAVLKALMDRLGVARASVVGHSMGGRIAWRFAAEFPTRVERLVLIAPDGFASPGIDYGVAPGVPLMMRMLPYALPAPMLRGSLEPAYANKAALTGPRFARYRDMMLAPGVRSAIIARMRQTILVDPEPFLRRIQVPTLLLWGEQDAMVPFSNAADYLRDIRGSQLASFPGVGHLPQEELPGPALAKLQAFLSAAK